METVLSGVGNILHCVGFNNNQFIDNLSCTEKVQLQTVEKVCYLMCFCYIIQL